MRVSDLRSFNRFKGSVYVAAGVILLVYALSSLNGPFCECPAFFRLSPAQVLIPATFFLFLTAIGVFLIVLGYFTIRHGGMPWKRLGTQNIAFAFAICFLGMIVADIVLYWAFS